MATKFLRMSHVLALGSVLIVGVVALFQPGKEPAHAASKIEVSPDSIGLNDKQLKYVGISTIGTHTFIPRRDAVGYVDFNEDTAVQVFSPWAGRIIRVMVESGDEVRQGQLLYTIDSPDLAQAESTLIAAAGVLKLTGAAKERAHGMLGTQAVAQKDYEQALSDWQTADANYRAARETVRMFSRTDADMDAIVSTQRIDSVLRITSPLAGRVAARNAAEGFLAQPGNAPAPITVADEAKLWLVANVAETDAVYLRLGQPMHAEISALPGRDFEARISNIGSSVDPNTHTLLVHSVVKDDSHLLKPQMLATFHIETEVPQHSVALPEGGLVREGDGTTVAFVTTDDHHFERRPVRVGINQDGLAQVISGLKQGERAATEGALLLSNALALQAR